jgi:hypothetical protein
MFSVKLTVTSRQQISARVTGLSQVNGAVLAAIPLGMCIHARSMRPDACLRMSAKTIGQGDAEWRSKWAI